MHELPVFIYEGYSDRELWAMAYHDQEQGETQEKFSVVDVWLDYKDKSDAGMTQQAIADALGVSQKNVGFKIQCASLPQSVLHRFSTSDILNERCARELLTLVPGTNFITRETVLNEIIDNVLSRKKEPTAKDFATEVERYNQLFQTYDGALSQLDESLHDEFTQHLVENKVRNAAQVNSVAQRFYEKEQERQEEEQGWGWILGGSRQTFIFYE